jgi:predicted nucleic acid-binding protein
MIVVLDSSAAVEIVLKREKGALFKGLLEASGRIITSEFFKVEVANVARKYYKGKYIQKDECLKLLTLSKGLVDEFVSIENDHCEALHEAIRLDYSVYDMLYLILARRHEAVLLTCDGPLNTIAEKEGIRTVGSYGFTRKMPR